MITLILQNLLKIFLTWSSFVHQEHPFRIDYQPLGNFKSNKTRGHDPVTPFRIHSHRLCNS